MYAAGSTTAVIEKAWTPAGGWTALESLGGSVSPGPVAAYDMLDGHQEVYVRGIEGPLYQKAWSGRAWSAWADLGGNISSL